MHVFSSMNEFEAFVVEFTGPPFTSANQPCEGRFTSDGEHGLLEFIAGNKVQAQFAFQSREGTEASFAIYHDYADSKVAALPTAAKFLASGKWRVHPYANNGVKPKYATVFTVQLRGPVTQWKATNCLPAAAQSQREAA